jgi:hypothetical protein
VRPDPDTRPMARTPEERAHDVLLAHQRRDIKGCTCGRWGSEHGQMGRSHTWHVLAELRAAGLRIIG